jgi:hypothetical protein
MQSTEKLMLKKGPAVCQFSRSLFSTSSNCCKDVTALATKAEFSKLNLHRQKAKVSL